MKTKILTLQICFVVLCSSQILVGQKINNICVLHPSPLTSTNLSNNAVTFLPNSKKTQLVTIRNPTTAPIQLGKLFLDGEDANQFALQSESLIKGTQPAENCSHKVLQPGGSCSFRVALLFNASANLYATLHIPGGGPCDFKIPVQLVGFVL